MGMTAICVMDAHEDCPDTKKDKCVCDCPCHLHQRDPVTKTKKKPHVKCDRAIRGCLAAFSAEKRKTQRFAGVVHNRWRDLCKVLNDGTTTEKQKLSRIVKITTKLGGTTDRFLR